MNPSQLHQQHGDDDIYTTLSAELPSLSPEPVWPSRTPPPLTHSPEPNLAPCAYTTNPDHPEQQPLQQPPLHVPSPHSTFTATPGQEVLQREYDPQQPYDLIEHEGK